MNKKSLITIVFLINIINVANNSYLIAQTKINSGLKGGIEVGTSITEDNGEFGWLSPGILLGYFTAINLYSFENSAIQVKTEFNFVNLQFYKLNQKYSAQVGIRGWNGLPYTELDEKYWFMIFEFGIMPSYQIQIDKDVVAEVFAGISGGIGFKDYTVVHLDENSLDSDHWDEYTSGAVGPGSINAGFTFFIKNFLIDLRYRYTKFLHEFNRKSEFNNLYLQIGFTI